MIRLRTKCPKCKKVWACELPITQEQFDNGITWLGQGAHMGAAFPDLIPQQLKALESGVCEDCWIEYYTEGKNDL